MINHNPTVRCSQCHAQDFITTIHETDNNRVTARACCKCGHSKEIYITSASNPDTTIVYSYNLQAGYAEF